MHGLMVPNTLPHLRAAEFLEEAGLRHCVVGDAVARRLGSPVVIGNLFIAVADEELEEACSVLRKRGLKPSENELELCYTGCLTHAFSAPGLLETLPTPINLAPASLWHLDLSPASISANTFLLDDTLCRFPDTLFYVDALISGIAEWFDVPGVHSEIAEYLHLQYVYVIELLNPDDKASLPPEDQLFIELFGNVILRSAMKTLCRQWMQIRKGQKNVDAARRCIPRLDLKIQAIKEKYNRRRYSEESESSSDESA